MLAAPMQGDGGGARDVGGGAGRGTEDAARRASGPTGMVAGAGCSSRPSSAKAAAADSSGGAWDSDSD